MTSSPDRSIGTNLTDLLSAVAPFEGLPHAVLAGLTPLLRPCRYRLGQTVLRPDALPEGLLLLVRGELRSLAPEPEGEGLRTIERLGPGALVGWVGLLRGRPCEHLRAITEVEALLLPAEQLRDLLLGQPRLSDWFQRQATAPEVHQVLMALAAKHPHWRSALLDWPRILEHTRVRSLAPGLDTELGLPPGWVWFVRSGARLQLAEAWLESSAQPLAASDPWLRLVGFPEQEAEATSERPGEAATELIEPEVQFGLKLEHPAGGGYSLSPEAPPLTPDRGGAQGSLALRRASGPREIPIAICEALADFFGLPVNRDVLRDQVEAVLQRQEQLNLVNLGQLLDGLGLRVTLTRVPADRLERVPVPAVLTQNGHIGLLDGVDANGQARLLEAELGPLRVPCRDLASLKGGLVEVLLLERKRDAKQQRFSWSWFAPLLEPHRRSLIEVVVASAALNVLALATPLGLRVVMSAAGQGNLGTVISIAVLMLACAVGVGLLRTLRSYILIETANRIDQEAKASILDHLVRLPQGFFDARPVGQITYYFNQLDRLREFLVGPSLTQLLDAAFVPLFVAVMFSISPILTLTVLSTLPFAIGVVVIANPLLQKQIKRTNREAMRMHSYLAESITGIQTLKSQNAELKTRWEFLNRYATFLGEDLRQKVGQETLANLASFINTLARLLVLVVGALLIIRGDINVGTYFAVFILSGFITSPLVGLTRLWQQYQLSRQQMQQVGDVVDRPTEQSQEDAQNIPMPPLQGKVQLLNVSFRYSEATPLVLQGINLEIPLGSFVGVVGGSGSGKSTLFKLLPRFYEPSDGKVLIDGLDVGKVELYSLRRQIGVVPQDSVLFDGSIRDNLQLVKPDASAEELIRAARIACAHDFIMELPKGYNSSVGERGAGLSGGQRQRLALARAVLQNPRLLILDEATSALDARTEREVCLNLLEAFRGRTVVFITHRLASVRSADQIVLMDRGAVMEQGSHAELMQMQGWYYALHQSQQQEGER
jgi:subfamily B ATP-binding cassette protein HlyB/CyaB